MTAGEPARERADGSGAPALEWLFHPRSIAVVGVPSGDPRGGNFLRALRALGYDQNHALYPVNPNLPRAAGLPCYPSLLACPGPVDHVISQVPAHAVPELVEHCVERGVRSLQLFTAGFSETGDPGRARIEQQAVARARSAGIRVIGPNCMGLYVPDERIAFTGNPPRDAGGVFLLSQSGVHAADLIFRLGAIGMRFSKVVSYGNGADLAAHDFLDYAADDPQTTVVGAYIEGVPDGAAFARALRRCARTKPTVVLKAGTSEAGARAVRSHTASLAGSARVFEALCRQAGAQLVQSMAELRQTLVALTSSAGRVRGPRVVMLSSGGGVGVLATDALARAGLEVPELPRGTRRELASFIPVAGTSNRNPIDAESFGGRGAGEGDAERRRGILRVVARSGVADVIVVSPGIVQGAHGSRVPWHDDAPAAAAPGEAREEARAFAADLAAAQEEAGCPVLYVGRDRIWGDLGPDLEMERALYASGIASYGSIEGAASVLRRMLDWRSRREGWPALF